MEPTNEQIPHMPEREALTTEQQIRRRTLKAFVWFGAASLVPVGIWKYIKTQPREGGLNAPIRAILNANEQVANTYFTNQNLAPTYPVAQAARQVRVNGKDGLRSEIDLAAWRLQINQPGKSLSLSLEDIKALPKYDLVFTFKCVEGWSQIQHWAGARVADLVANYGVGTLTGQPANNEADYYPYMGLETPDRGYYVGLDIASALHPQSILAYEMNGEPLTVPHGAPLRLIIPVKYGVKNLKRIGTITFATARPRDFWAERGYDYHLGL
jgi:DMSO/TMAO reductase YedYZ molybdopterin-dependent catalytic subunit